MQDNPAQIPDSAKQTYNGVNTLHQLCAVKIRLATFLNLCILIDNDGRDRVYINNSIVS